MLEQLSLSHSLTGGESSGSQELTSSHQLGLTVYLQLNLSPAHLSGSQERCQLVLRVMGGSLDRSGGISGYLDFVLSETSRILHTILFQPAG